MYNAVYFPGCPWSGGDTRDRTRGDNHCWDVWHGTMQPYQNWDRLIGRFESEWGMQAFPDIRTIDYWLDGAKGARTPTSKLVQHHQKAQGGEDRLNKYIDDNFKRPADLEGYVYISQLMQSDCVASAMQTWRRGFIGPQSYECAGSMIWQLNDCWPVISWSIVDYFLRPKSAYFAMKRGLAPLACGMKRRPSEDWEIDCGEVSVDLWLSNTSAQPLGRIEVITEVFGIERGNLIEKNRHERPHVAALSCLELGAAVGVPQMWNLKRVVSMRVVDPSNGHVLARLMNWPDPMKDVELPRPEDVALEVEVHSNYIAVKSNRPVKGLTFSLKTDDVQLLDNCVDLAPRQEQRIAFKGKLTADLLSWRYLGDGH